MRSALDAITEKLLGLQSNGLLSEGQVPADLVKNITVTSNLEEAVTGATYIQVSKGVLTDLYNIYRSVSQRMLN